VFSARSLLVLGGVALATAGCGGAAKRRTPASRPSRSLSVSSAFAPGATIPVAYTCDGGERSLPLRAAGVPRAAVEIVVVMRDPDAPGGDFIHWAVAHLVPRRGTISLPAGRAPARAVLGRNSFGSLGYRGPCPPAGAAHHYVITVLALAAPSAFQTGFSADALSSLHVLARGSLTGLYARR
jgi:Raf kinase inhibitor-like YbhB/YbcL family protein